MSNQKENHNLWNDYLVIGLAVGILLTILDYSRDSFYQIILVITFICVTGVKDNIIALWSFMKKYWMVGTIFAAYVFYYIFINKYVESSKFVAAMFFVFLGGYIFEIRAEGDQEYAYRKLWAVMLAINLLDIVKMSIESQVGYFMNYTVELGAVVIFATISFLYLKEVWLKIAGAIVSVWSAALVLKNRGLNLKNIFALKGILPEYISGGIKNMTFGRGQLVAHSVVNDYSENTFATILFDYGIVMFAIYLAVLAFAIILIIKCRDSLLRRQAILVCVMLIISTIFTMQYWSNIVFLIWSGIGVMIGRFEYVKDNPGDKVKQVV